MKLLKQVRVDAFSLSWGYFSRQHHGFQKELGRRWKCQGISHGMNERLWLCVFAGEKHAVEGSGGKCWRRWRLPDPSLKA